MNVEVVVAQVYEGDAALLQFRRGPVVVFRLVADVAGIVEVVVVVFQSSVRTEEGVASQSCAGMRSSSSEPFTDASYDGGLLRLYHGW